MSCNFQRQLKSHDIANKKIGHIVLLLNSTSATSHPMTIWLTYIMMAEVANDPWRVIKCHYALYISFHFYQGHSQLMDPFLLPLA